MEPLELVDLGSTGLKATRLGLGGAPLGSSPPRLSDEEAVATIREALALGMRNVDTAPSYGRGRSEMRYGEALSEVPRDSYVISTKVGRVLKTEAGEELDFTGMRLTDFPDLEPNFDFSRDAVLRSFDQSLQRLRLDRVNILFLHDVPAEHFRMAIEEAFPTIAELRSQGVVSAIGAGVAPLDLLLGFAREGDFDCFLVPNRYTLTEQTAIEEFFPLCQEKGIFVILGAPYNQGRMLRDGNQSPEEVAHLQRYRDICERYDVPIRAAALQFVVAHPLVATVIPGPVSMDEMTDTIRMAQLKIPGDFWQELLEEGLIAEGCPVPVD